MGFRKPKRHTQRHGGSRNYETLSGKGYTNYDSTHKVGGPEIIPLFWMGNTIHKTSRSNP